MPRIAVFTKNRTNPAYEAARLGADRTAARLGATTVHYVPDKPDSVPEQIALIARAIAERPDAAVFVPVDETAVNDAILGFDAARIPLFNIITRTTAGQRITFVGSDDRALARNIARYLFGKLSRRSTIIILEGTPFKSILESQREGGTVHQKYNLRRIWDQVVADPKKAYRLTGGPLVARGKVMIGTTGRAEGGNYIAALDAETGKEAWRFYTVARPNEHGGKSWNGLPLEKRNGGSVWIPGSYDPVQNLAFFGPGNTYDTGPLRDPVNQPGVTNDALYLDSTLALDPETGRLAWSFQHQANGQWDLDWAFERMVMQLPVNGDLRSVVVTAGKQMIFDIVETETGKYVSSIDLGLQNLVTSIDPKTGAKINDPNHAASHRPTKRRRNSPIPMNMNG